MNLKSLLNLSQMFIKSPNVFIITTYNGRFISKSKSVKLKLISNRQQRLEYLTIQLLCENKTKWKYSDGSILVFYLLQQFTIKDKKNILSLYKFVRNALISIFAYDTK